MSKSDRFKNVSQEEFNSWKTSSIGSLFFKDLLNSLKEDNMFAVFDQFKSDVSSELLARDYAVRAEMNSFLGILQQIDFEGLKEYFEEDSNDA